MTLAVVLTRLETCTEASQGYRFRPRPPQDSASTHILKNIMELQHAPTAAAPASPAGGRCWWAGPRTCTECPLWQLLNFSLMAVNRFHT